MSDSITFYLVRHGEAENNVSNIGNSFPEKRKMFLTKKGIKQVMETAELLSQKGIDAIISSPLERTRETAALISEKTGVEVLIDERLHEVGLGVYNDKSLETFFSKYPDMRARISMDQTDGAESYIDMCGRIESLLCDIKQVYANKKVVIVSHGDVLDQLYGILTHESIGQALDDDFYPKNASCEEVVWRG
ncbi:MAG: histidine phosphatase family protein [bacterium]|nr:histidine phosphatase family protein [bacterium]